MDFKAIGRRIGKAQTTVSREVKRHIVIVTSNAARKEGYCKAANEPCKNLLKPPFVCNPCKRRHCACVFDKHLYYGKKAHEAYEKTLIEAREGIPLTKQEFYDDDKIISDGIKNGQHLYHILETNAISASKSAVYRYLQKGYLSVCAIDFPRVVKFKPRKGTLLEYVPKTLKVGRTYNDFLAHIAENNISSWVEMDTVVGRVGGKTILTFDFTFCNFMFGLLLEGNSAGEVSSKLKKLKASLKAAGRPFGEIFPLGLTDNGGEFSNVLAFEADEDGEIEARLFFCDPLRSNQKPHVEKNHTLFRDIAPKGTSFDSFTQNTVNLIFSHVNNVKRKSLGGKTPYDLFAFTFGKEILDIIGIEKIHEKNVIQSPKLLKD
jgi:IS30 family transposase